MGTGRVFVAALLALALSAVVSAAESPHIRFAEKITVNPGTTQTQFDAYGRRFALNLQSNDRALARLRLNKQRASISGIRLWRGTLDGQTGTWVRLTERGGASEGVIWDGRDLYVVTRYGNVADSLGVPLAAQPDETVIFRLSDATNLLPDAYCGSAPSPDGLAPNNALVQYRNMVAELQVRMQGIALPTMGIEISMIADSAYANAISDPVAAMFSSFNIVDGIYAEQLGLVIVPSDVRTIPAAGDPFTSTDPATLLGQLSTYRQNTPAVAATGIAHLFTGKDLDDDVAGIAHLNGACSVSNGVGLSEGRLGSITTGLVMAHELGHNFGADHDGFGACAGVPDVFLMSPAISGSQQFSQCSMNAISSFLAQASCVTPASYPQVELPQTTIRIFGERDVPLVVPFELHSTGTLAVNDVRLDVSLYGNFELTATTPGVTCAPGPTTPGLRCDVGSVAGRETKLVELTFLPVQVGTYSIEATVTASNNRTMRNNRQGGTVSISGNVDASVSVTTSVPVATFGDLVDVTLTVNSLRSRTALNVRVGVDGGGLRGESVTAPAGVTCQFDVDTPGRTYCDVGDIPGGETRTIVVHSRASQVGTGLQGNVNLSADNDAEYGNNFAYFPMSITAAHDVGLEDVMPLDTVQFGMPYEFRANLRSHGSQAVDGVRVDVGLSMGDPAGLEDVSSVTVGGNACTRLESWHYECAVGTMAAGEVLPLSIQGTATRLGGMQVTLDASANVNDNPYNDHLYRIWTVRYGLDVAVGQGVIGNVIQGVEQSGSFAVTSWGIHAANGVVMDLELPPQLRLTRFTIYAGSPDCEIVDPQHLHCTDNVPAGGSTSLVGFFIMGDVPGEYQGSATVELAGDENLANNSVQFPIRVYPLVDVGVRSAGPSPDHLVVGHDVTIPLEVFAGGNPVTGVVFDVFTYPGAEVVSVSVGSGTCERASADYFNCTLGDIAAQGTVAVSAVVRATAISGTIFVSANVGAPGENGTSANYFSKILEIVPVGDAILEIESTTVTATAGTQFTLPGITVRRQGQVADGRLMITLPSGLTFVSMSGAILLCSGTATLECQLPSSWPENQGIQVNVRVNPSASGSFVVSARVTAVNDFTNGNDEGSIAVTVNPAQTTPPPSPPVSGGGSSGSKSGGGGRIEWPLTFLLGLMLLYRQRRAGSHPRRARLRQKVAF